MKWCWPCVAVGCLTLSAVAARGQGANDLLQQGDTAMAAGDYATAAKDYDTIVTTFPSTSNLEEIIIRAGYAYLHAGNYPKTISELQKLTDPSIKPEIRGKALFFTGLAEFSQAQAVTDHDKSVELYREAEESLTTLLTFIQANPTPDNTALLEDTLYYQALAAFGQGKYDQAESDLNNLLAKFSDSLQKPDYLLLLGSIYAVQANNAVNAKSPPDQVRAAARKAIDTFDQVANDPNALVQANEANMDKGNVLSLVASLDLPSTAGYDKALDVYRLIHRKDDMIAIQQQRLDQLRASQGAVLRNGGSAVGASNRLLDRETTRLDQLKNAPDPIVQALISMADCYVSMKQPNEARTILRRLHTVPLTDDQKQDVDFQFLYSYTLGGQAEKADAALQDYLAKHPGDPNADSISVQISAALMNRGDFEGSLKQAQESLKDFPGGKHVGEAVDLESEALTKLNRLDEATQVIDNFLKKNPNNPAAYGLLIAQGEGQLDKGNLAGALESFGKVKDSPAAGDFRAAAAAYYVQVLNSLQRYDDVIKESQAFQKSYPQDKARPSVEVLGAIAMDKKGDPKAIAALQAVAKLSNVKPEIGSFSLYYVFSIYQRENKTPEMMQAAKDLGSAFPTAYALISQVNDGVVTVLEKQKKFDEAAALYQPLVAAPLKDVASLAQNKIGDVWLAAARAMGSYQSLPAPDARTEAERRLGLSEQGYVATLKNFPDQLDSVGDAFQGLVNTGLLRVRWGLVKESDLEDYLGRQGSGLTSPEMQARLEMTKAGLVFAVRKGHDHDAEALARFDKALAASPNLNLTVQEADQYGELLIGAKQYAKAQAVFKALLATASPNQSVKLAEGDYGMAASYLAQGDYANAKGWLVQMLGLPGGIGWSKHAVDAQIGMAEIEEQSNAPSDLTAAQQAYSEVMRSPAAGAENTARAMLGYGRILEKQGHAVKAAGQADIEYATHYYEQVNLFYGKALPELSAEGLYLAGQAYAKAGDTANAQKSYDLLRANYANTAPDWVAKAPVQ